MAAVTTATMMFRAAVTAVLLSLTACGGSTGDHGATLRADVVGSATDEAGTPRRALAGLTQAGLVRFDAAGRVVPDLASSWRVADDGLSVIFRLRARQWPDDKPVTASDVVAAFHRATLPANHQPLRLLLTPVTVDAPVDTVVEVRLAGAMPGILALLAQPDLAVIRSGPRPPPLGPFRVAHASKRPIVLTRDPAAPPDPAITLGGVTLNPVADPGAAIARFAHARTDIVLGDGMAGYDDARLLAGSLRVEPAWGVYGYLINTRSGALADVRVRRALAMAIDRDDLGTRLFGVALPPVLGLVPPLPSEPVPALPDWAIAAPAARLDLARQLLAAAGYGPATPLTVTISLPDAREHAAVAADVTASWARIGVHVQTVTSSPEEHALAVARGSFELALVERTSPVDTPLAFLLPFTCGAGGGGITTGAGGGTCNPAADGLIGAARTTCDPAAAAVTLGAAEAALVADTPMIALFAPIRWALVSPRVTGWSNNAAGQHPLALLGIARSR